MPVFSSIDLDGAMESNRFFDYPIQVRQVEDGRTWIQVTEREKDIICYPFFAYSYIGMTPTGVHVIETASNGGGTGIFCDLLFLEFQQDEVMTNQSYGIHKRDRVLLKCVGALGLGDRYDGEIRLTVNELIIGRRQHFFVDDQPDDLRVLL